MDKCYMLVDSDNGNKWGLFLSRADAEEMCLAWSEEIAYDVFFDYFNRWDFELETSLGIANQDFFWRVDIQEYNLY